MKSILLSFILFSSLLFSQSVKNLDLKNGFRNFKFGSSPTQIKNIIKQDNQYSKNPRVTTYEYVGTDVQYVANIKVEKTTLDFFDNKLMMVGVSFGNIDNQTDFTESDYNNVKIWLEQAYGKNWFNAKNNEGNIQNGVIWDGSKVRLELIRIDFSKSLKNPQENGYISGYISVYDKNLNRQMFESDF